MMQAPKFSKKHLASLDGPKLKGIVGSKHDKPVASLMSITSDAGLIGSTKGRITIKGDIMSTGIGWTAER